MWGRGLGGTVLLALLSTSFQSLPLLPTSKLGPSGADSWVGGFVYVLGPCGSPMDSPVRLGVSPTASTPTGFLSQRFETLFPCTRNLGLSSLSCFPVVPPGLSACGCGTALSVSCCLAHPSPPAAALPGVLSAWLPISAPPLSLIHI